MTAYTIESVCITRVNSGACLNRNNLYADGSLLESGNRGLRRAVSRRTSAEGVKLFSLLEGKGDERAAGEAAQLAGQMLDDKLRELDHLLLTPRTRLDRCHESMNRALLESGGKAEVVTALLTPEEIYIYNAGAARAYRLRSVELMQLSRDNGAQLGTAASELAEERYLARGELLPGDIYILCNRDFSEKLNLLHFFDLRNGEGSMKEAAEKLIALLPEEDSALLLLRILRE